MLLKHSRLVATLPLVVISALVLVRLEPVEVCSPVWHIQPPCSRIPSLKASTSVLGVLQSIVLMLTFVKGLFAGLSLEGTVLIERKDANAEFYGSPVPAKDILTGRVPPPEVASKMYEIIEVSKLCIIFPVHLFNDNNLMII